VLSAVLIFSIFAKIFFSSSGCIKSFNEFKERLITAKFSSYENPVFSLEFLIKIPPIYIFLLVILLLFSK
jgi:hypothetical protein